MGCLRASRLGVAVSMVVHGALLLANSAAAQDKPKVEIVSQVGHSDSVTAFAFSPDSKLILSGGMDKTVKLWDLATGKLIRDFRGHTTYVTSINFSPDGKTALSSASDAESDEIKLWDLATGRELRQFHKSQAHRTGVRGITHSPDGKTALQYGDAMVLWDLESGQSLRTFDAPAKQIAIAWSPDGKSLMMSTFDESLHIWEVGTGQKLRTLIASQPEASGTIDSIAISPDGQTALSNSAQGTVNLWEMATGRVLRALGPRASFIAYSADGKNMLAAYIDSDRTAFKIWDLSTGSEVRSHSLSRHQHGHTVTAFSRDRKFAAFSNQNIVEIWNLETGFLERELKDIADSIAAVAITPDGRALTEGIGGQLELWDLASGRAIRELYPKGSKTAGDQTGSSLRSIAISPDGKLAISADGGIPRQSGMTLWDLSATNASARILKGAGSVTAITISPNNKAALSGGYDKELKEWELRSGRIVRTLKGHSGPILSVAISPDGKTALSGGFDGMWHWNLISGKVIRKFTALDGVVTSVAFSPDGKGALSGSDGGEMVTPNATGGIAALWDLSTGKEIRKFRGHSRAVVSVAFVPGSDAVLTSGADGTVKVWDIHTGRETLTLRGHSGPITGAAVRHDGRTAISGGSDGTLRVWDIHRGEELASLMASPGGEKLAITPKGFFISSQREPRGLALVRGLEVTTIDQVHQSLFNPDLVHAGLAGDPNGEMREAAKVINLEKVLDSGPAPFVEFVSHPAGSQSVTDDVTLQVRITDNGKGIGRIEWRVKGVTAAVAFKPEGQGPEYTVTQRLALDPGENTVEVVAYNGTNLLASPAARTTIAFTGPADQAKPKLHILAIGINAYIDKGWAPPGKGFTQFPRLTLAVKDATTFGADMMRAAGSLYEEVRVTHALDSGATRTNLDAAIDKLASDVHPRDTFILFVAAHGASENGRFYIIPQDFQSGPDALARSAIGQDRLQDWLANRITAKKALILLDTCESGALVAGHTRSRVDISEAGVGRLHEATGRPVLTAAAIGQFAHEGLIAQSGDHHGVFTWALLDALRHADTNGNGQIELSEVVAHVQSIVPKIAAKFGGDGRAAIAASGPVSGKQSARFGSTGEDFVLARRLQQ